MKKKPRHTAGLCLYLRNCNQRLQVQVLEINLELVIRSGESVRAVTICVIGVIAIQRDLAEGAGDAVGNLIGEFPVQAEVNFVAVSVFPEIIISGSILIGVGHPVGAVAPEGKLF